MMMKKLAVEISDAADLAPKDGAASCNPYVEVEFDEQRQRTATKPADRNPYWNQTLLFDVRDAAAASTSSFIEVSVLHDRRQDQSASALRPHTAFLGRVRINAASVAQSPQEALLQRYPLEKRGLFSRVSGDIALRIYYLLTTHDHEDLHQQPPAPNHQQQHQQEEEVVVVADQEGRTKTQQDEPPPPRPRIFRSVPPAPAASESRRHHHHQQEQPQPRRATLHAVSAPPPPPGQTVVMPRPAAAAGPPPAPGSNFGLVETKPPLPAKMGPRAAAAAAAKIASTYDMVEPMTYLYVSVVKARDLPSMDVTGALDPYVEVKLGNFKGVTKHLEKNPNPVWRQTFAFSREHLQSNQLEVVVKDKDMIKDDLVGRVVFDMIDIPHRVPPDSPLAPQWYRLMRDRDRSAEKLRHGEIMLAVWIGTQADEAFPEAWHSDAHSLPLEGLANTRSKVYYSPKLAYLKVVAIAAQDVIPAEKGRPLAPVIAKIQLGGQIRRTRPHQGGSANPVWNEEFMFVAGEPFDEPLVVTVEERVAAGRDEPVGRVIVPVAAPYVPRNDVAKSVESKWFNLSRALTADEAAAGAHKDHPPKFASKIHLRLSLETAYHVLDESTHYSSDLQPSAKKLRKGSIGILELGNPERPKPGARQGQGGAAHRPLLRRQVRRQVGAHPHGAQHPGPAVERAVHLGGVRPLHRAHRRSIRQRPRRRRLLLGRDEEQAGRPAHRQGPHPAIDSGDRPRLHPLLPAHGAQPVGPEEDRGAPPGGALHLHRLGQHARHVRPPPAAQDALHPPHLRPAAGLPALPGHAAGGRPPGPRRAPAPPRGRRVHARRRLPHVQPAPQQGQLLLHHLPLLRRRRRRQVDGRHLQVEEPAHHHPGARAVPHPGVLPGAHPAHRLPLPLHDRGVELPPPPAQAAAHGHAAVARRAGAPGRAGRGVRHLPHQQARGRRADALRPPAQRRRPRADGRRRPRHAGGARAVAAQLAGPEGHRHLHHALAARRRRALRHAVPGRGRRAGAIPPATPALPEQAAVRAIQLLQEAARKDRHAALATRPRRRAAPRP